MDANTVEFVKALTALAWPLIAAVVLWKLFPSLKEIVTSRAFSVKVGEMQISVQDATEQFRAQIDDLQKQVMQLRSQRPSTDEPSTPASAAADRPSPGAVAPPPRILWVDDKPSNNALEIAQLRERGIDVVTVASTEEAMAALSRSSFAAVLSDMGRWEGGGYHARAGLTLLTTLRGARNNVPFLVYSSQRNAAQNRADVIAASGDGATASPVELFEWVEGKLGLKDGSRLTSPAASRLGQ